MEASWGLDPRVGNDGDTVVPGTVQGPGSALVITQAYNLKHQARNKPEAELLTMAPAWKQASCPSAGEQINAQ